MRSGFCVWFCTLCCAISVLAFAAAGDPDPGFGAGGVVLANYSATSNILGTDLIIQSTGKIVVVGQYFDSAGTQIVLTRFSSAGVLDPAFGTSSGWTILNFGYQNIYASAAVEQSDGSIVVVGPANHGAANQYFIARFTLDGLVDASFGNAGISPIDFGVNALAQDIALNNDGKFVIAGFVGNGLDNNWGIARVDKKGKIDKSFGKHGLVVTDFHGFLDRASAVAVQPDNKIVVGGTAHTAASYGVMAIARYTDKGELDNTFGTGGKVVTDFGSANDDFGISLQIQTDGKIVQGGFAQPVEAVFTFVRYNTNGTIDLSHLEDHPGTNFDPSYGLAIATNGKIILGGRVVQNLEVTAALALSCYDGTTGSLDLNFGASGWVIHDVGPDYENIHNLKLQTDNKIVAVGFSLQGDGRYYLALARYIGCN